jgi:hypothetical protein
VQWNQKSGRAQPSEEVKCKVAGTASVFAPPPALALQEGQHLQGCRAAGTLGLPTNRGCVLLSVCAEGGNMCLRLQLLQYLQGLNK